MSKLRKILSRMGNEKAAAAFLLESLKSTLEGVDFESEECFAIVEEYNVFWKNLAGSRGWNAQSFENAVEGWDYNLSVDWKRSDHSHSITVMFTSVCGECIAGAVYVGGERKTCLCCGGEYMNCKNCNS